MTGRSTTAWRIAAGLPPAALLWLLWRDAIDVPFWDQWEFVETIARTFESGPHWSDLWAQHNEHRLIFPKLAMLALARSSGWNVLWEMATSLLCASASFVLLAATVRRTIERVDGDTRLTGPTVALLSLLIFSPAQWENWLWGWQLQIFMNVLAVVSCVHLLTARRRGPLQLAGAVALGVVAAYSFANGIAVWILGAGILALRTDRQAITRPVALSVWITAGVLSSAAYLSGYESVPWHPAPLDGLRDPVAFVLHVLHYLGGPLGALHAGASAVAGALGVVVLFAGAWRLLSDETIERRLSLALAAPGVYAVGCATITAIGRAGMGSEQALASKYVTLATLLWVSVAGIAATIVALRLRDVRDERDPGETEAVEPIVAVAAAALVVVLVGALSSGVVGVKAAATRSELLRPYPDLLRRHATLSPAERAVLASIHPSPELLADHISLLERHRLSVFRHDEPDR